MKRENHWISAGVFFKTDNLSNWAMDWGLVTFALLNFFAYAWSITVHDMWSDLFRALGIASGVLCITSILLALAAQIISHAIYFFLSRRAKLKGDAPLILKPENPRVIKMLTNSVTKISKNIPNRTLCIASATPQRYSVSAHANASRSAFCRAPRTQKRSTSSSNNAGDDDSGSSDPSDPPQQLTPLEPQFIFPKIKKNSSAFAQQAWINTPLLVGACLLTGGAQRDC